MAFRLRNGLAFFRNFGFSLSEAVERMSGSLTGRPGVGFGSSQPPQYTHFFKKIMVLCPHDIP